MPKVQMPTTDEQEILKVFKEGDRVFLKSNQQHAVFNAFYNGQCWVQYELEFGLLSSSRSAELTDLKLCHCHSLPDTVSQERAGIAKARSPQDIPLSGHSNMTSTPPASTDPDFHSLDLSKPTSEPLATNLLPGFQESTSLSSEVLVRTFPALATEPELLELTQACFLKESDFCNFKSLKCSSLKMWEESSRQTEEKTSILSSVPSRNWGMWGIGKSAMGSETSPKDESESFLWVLTGDVRCNKVKENRPSLIDCLDAPGVGIVDRARGGDRTYLDIAPTIRTASVDKNGHQGGNGNFKVIESSGITRPVRPEELERLMGWEVSSTAFGTTIDGEIVPISNTQRHRMLGNGIIPAEIEDICKHLRPFLEAQKAMNSPVTLPILLESPLKLLHPRTGLSATLTSLSIDEERDRHRLEIKVERESGRGEDSLRRVSRAFYEAGKALEEIRDRKLYRSTHKTFKEYCEDRFGMKQSRSYQMIDAARVVENLQKVPQFVELLPTNESQCRYLSTLTEGEQVEAWGEAIKLRSGKRPTQTTVKTAVKSIVERIKEKTFVPYTELAEYLEGDVITIKAGCNSTLRGMDGYWGIIDRISSFAYHVLISVKNEVVLCKVEEMKRVELGGKDRAEIKEVSDRIKKLQQCTLDDADDQLLDLLQRRTIWTNRQLLLLQRMEEDYFAAVASSS